LFDYYSSIYFKEITCSLTICLAVTYNYVVLFIFIIIIYNYNDFYIQMLFIAWCVFYFKIKFLIYYTELGRSRIILKYENHMELSPTFILECRVLKNNEYLSIWYTCPNLFFENCMHHYILIIFIKSNIIW